MTGEKRRRLNKTMTILKAKEKYTAGIMSLIKRVQQDPRGRDPQQQLDFIVEWLQQGQEMRREAKGRVREELDNIQLNWIS